MVQAIMQGPKTKNCEGLECSEKLILETLYFVN